MCVLHTLQVPTLMAHTYGTRLWHTLVAHTVARVPLALHGLFSAWWADQNLEMPDRKLR